VSQFESQFEADLYRARREKLAQIAALGQPSYPNSFAFTHTLTQTAADIPALLPLGLHPDGTPKTAEDLEAEHLTAAIAGRIVAIRLQGKAGFATLLQNGARLQIYVRKDDVGEDLFNLYKLLDLGDHIGVRGYLMRTRTGELTLKGANLSDGPAITFLAKALLPLPDKYSGLGDIELRYRRRYLDLFTDTGDTAETPTDPGAPRLDSETWVEPPQPSAEPQLTRQPAREVFVKRAAILRSIRRFFDTRGYLEVETPMLHTIAGGAAARPFTTHHNALDIPLNLRIAPELYLKRLVVGGLDRVYEINRNFRNEGVSTQHNPEFTMLEFYQAYANYEHLMDLTQELITTVAKEVNGTTIARFTLPKGPRAGEIVELDLAQWQKLSMRDAIKKFWKAAKDELFTDRQLLLEALQREHEAVVAESNRLRQEAIDLNAKLDAHDQFSSDTPPPMYEEDKKTAWSCVRNSVRLAKFAEGLKELAEGLDAGVPIGKTISGTFELFSEPHLIPPTIIYDFPLAVSPLSKIKPDEPDWVERFEFYIGGFEVGNAFSELNDPDDQLRRFEAQLEDRKRGDDEAMAEVDEDYVRALGYGLPPTAGEGIGIDRLTMILTGSRSIRDVILFPLMRPQKPTSTEEPEHTHGESSE
jgi:lysyl-tRNA synthetase class 2